MSSPETILRVVRIVVLCSRVRWTSVDLPSIFPLGNALLRVGGAVIHMATFSAPTIDPGKAHEPIRHESPFWEDEHEW